jgi:hypothetical protein
MQQEIINERIISAVACTPWDSAGVDRIMGVIESKGMNTLLATKSDAHIRNVYGYRQATIDRMRGRDTKHHRAKMDMEDVQLILALRDHGLSYKAIAEKFECGISTVRDITKGRTRKVA